MTQGRSAFQAWGGPVVLLRCVPALLERYHVILWDAVGAGPRIRVQFVGIGESTAFDPFVNSSWRYAKALGNFLCGELFHVIAPFEQVVQREYSIPQVVSVCQVVGGQEMARNVSAGGVS